MSDGILRDLRFAVRLYQKQSAFSIITILTLGLGVGSLTIVFGACNAVLLAPLPYVSTERLVFVEERNLTQASEQMRISYPDYTDLRDSIRSLDRIAAYSSAVVTLTGEVEPERIQASMVSPDCFPTLGVRPILGQAFSTTDSDAQQVILGFELWKRLFNSSPTALGQALNLNETSFRIVGVMPNGFHLPFQTDELWVPLMPNPGLSRARASHWLYTVGLVKSGARLSQVQSELEVFSQRLEEKYPATNQGWTFQSVGLRNLMVKDVGPTLIVLFAGGTLLLLVSCVNVGNLLLARATTRQGEMATRVALGASRSRLVRQILTEALLLAALAFGVGLGLGVVGIRALNVLAPPTFTSINPILLDRRVLGFALLISFLSMLIFALVPALKTSRGNLLIALNETGRNASSGLKQHRLQSWLVIAEVCICFLVLVGTSLLVRSAVRLSDVDLGFNPKNLLTVQLSLPFAKYRGGAREINTYLQILERIEALRGIESAGAVSDLPVSGSTQKVPIKFSYQIPSPTKEEPEAEMRVVTESALRTLNVPLLAGRGFSNADTIDAPKVVLINRSFARRYWPSENPINKHFSIDGVCVPSNPCEIVGIVGDMRSRGLQLDPEPEVYVPMEQNWWGTMTLVLRTASAPLKALPDVRQAIWAVDKNLPLSRVRSMEDVISGSVATRRLAALGLSFMAGLVLILSTVGIYGTISFVVNQRIRELGIRMALGAPGHEISKLVVFQGLRLTGAGIVIGIVLALFTMRLLASFLFGVSPTDPLSFLVVSSVLIGAAFIASYVPARQATRLDLLAVLKAE
jgi:putative ABC transport system permease protein